MTLLRFKQGKRTALFRSIARQHASLKIGRAESSIEQTPAASGISSRFRDADKQRRQVDAIEIRPRMADGGRVRKACAGRRRERRARLLREDARLLDHGGKSLRVP